MRLELKAIKKEGILFKVGRSLLLIAILLILFFRLKDFQWGDYTWSLPNNFFVFAMAIFLVFANWFLEWKKWKISIYTIGDYEESQIKRGFYAGMVSGFLTPSALGNFIGRMIQFKDSDKPKVVSYTLFANGAQFCVSLFFGALSLFLVTDLPNSLNSSVVLNTVVILAFVSMFLYFNIDKFPFLRRLLIKYVPSFTEVSIELRVKFLLLSVFRYLIFSFQFYLLILAFEPQTDLIVWFWIWNLYLWTTLSPSLFMGKLFIRETMAVFVLTEAGVSLPVALISSLILWCLNNALPSLFAYLKCKRNVVV